jgi:hypothetical protein
VTSKYTSVDETNFFHLGHARWLVGILGLLIGVVGRETLLGLILRQTRSDIASLVRDEEPATDLARDGWFPKN